MFHIRSDKTIFKSFQQNPGRDYRTARSHSGFEKASGSIMQNLIDDGIDFKLENRNVSWKKIQPIPYVYYT